MAELWLEPYEEAVGEFPITGPPRELLTAALGWAVRAPSVHNTQPWRFRILGDQVAIYLDSDRVLRRADPDGREATISCGAALEFLHLTLRRFGFEAPVALTPDSGRFGPLLARVRLGEARRVDPTDRQLFEAIRWRATNRRAYRRKPVPEEVLSRATRRAKVVPVRLQIVRDPIDRAVVADLVSEADRRQMADPPFRRELARWLRPAGSSKRDGIPAGAGKGPRTIKPIAPLVIRTFDLGGGLAAIDRRIATGSPVLAILWSRTDDRIGWLEAGRALARLLLSLAGDGVAVSYLNQPLEVPAIRRRLRELWQRAGDCPQLILRAGYGPAVSPTPRRPVDRVLQR
jgi:hypothetical protein